MIHRYRVHASLALLDAFSFLGKLNLLDEETISWLLDAKFDKGMSKGRSWTGASHWKYPQAANRPRFERDSVTRQRRRCDPSLESMAVSHVAMQGTEDQCRLRASSRHRSLKVQETRERERDHDALQRGCQLSASNRLQIQCSSGASTRWAAFESLFLCAGLFLASTAFAAFCQTTGLAMEVLRI